MTEVLLAAALCISAAMLAGCGGAGSPDAMRFPTQDDGNYDTPYSMGEGQTFRTTRFDPNRNFGDPFPNYDSLAKKWRYSALQFENLLADETSASFDAAKPVSEGLAAVRRGDAWGYAELLRDQSSSDAVNGEYGFRMAIEAVYEMADPFSGGLAAVRTGGLYGYVDGAGEMVVAPRFLEAHWFESTDSLAAVREADGWRYIDMSGMVAISGPFEEAESFTTVADLSRRDDGTVRPAVRLAAAKSEGLWGYLDETGAWAILPAFEDAWAFEGNTAPVKKNGKWIWIGTDGKKAGSVRNPAW